MAKVVLGITDLATEGLITFARMHKAKMLNNPNYPTPTPTPEDLDAAIAAAETKLSNYRGALISVAQARDESEMATEALREVLNKRGDYIQTASGGNPVKIESAGVRVKAKSSPIGPVSPPTKLEVKLGKSDKMLRLKWKPSRGAKSYIVEMAIGTPENYTRLGTCTASKYDANNLVSGTRYWFQIAAVGSQGESTFSDPATKIAP